ncbi:hypothetical protein HD806DRAFT_488483 [Xylariaceae sp. AK1471]|nr:hypothetical protein HD806DRAFT_488483 [Xylariaceae sp. AK1471]
MNIGPLSPSLLLISYLWPVLTETYKAHRSEIPWLSPSKKSHKIRRSFPGPMLLLRLPDRQAISFFLPRSRSLHC